jgi:hypothetical protein
MVDVKHRRCEHQGCSKESAFDVEGSRIGRFCAQHKLDGMVNMRKRKRD